MCSRRLPTATPTGAAGPTTTMLVMRGEALGRVPEAQREGCGTTIVLYLNDEGKETSTNMLCVTTENNEVQWIRALDCKTIFTPQNVHFEYVPNEIPYRTVRGYWEVYYVTSNGIYSAYSGMMGGSGVLGAYDGTGGSVHVVSGASGAYYGILYWSNQTRSFETSDYNAGYAPASSGVPGYGTQNLDLECLACGLNMAAGEKQFFLMQDRSNPSKKYIYYF